MAGVIRTQSVLSLGAVSIMRTPSGFSAPLTLGVPGVSTGVTYFANRPAGYTTISDNPFTALPKRGVSTPDGWDEDSDDDAARLSLITDASAPFPDHPVLHGTFPYLEKGGGAFFRIDRNFASGEQFKNLYFSTIVQLSTNFTMNGNTGCKYIWPAADQVDGAQNYTNFDTEDLNAFPIQQGNVDREYFSNTGPTNQSSMRRGGWLGRYAEIEYLYKANTANGTANGELYEWVGGALTNHYTDCNWQMTASRKWLSISLQPTYGGGENVVPVQNMYMRWNRIVIAGSNT